MLGVLKHLKLCNIILGIEFGLFDYNLECLLARCIDYCQQVDALGQPIGWHPGKAICCFLLHYDTALYRHQSDDGVGRRLYGQ